MTTGESGYCLTQVIQPNDSVVYGGIRPVGNHYNLQMEDSLNEDGSVFVGVYDVKNENHFLEVSVDVSPVPEGPGAAPCVTIDGPGAGAIMVFPSDEGFIIFNAGGKAAIVITGGKAK